MVLSSSTRVAGRRVQKAEDRDEGLLDMILATREDSWRRYVAGDRICVAYPVLG